MRDKKLGALDRRSRVKSLSSENRQIVSVCANTFEKITNFFEKTATFFDIRRAFAPILHIFLLKILKNKHFRENLPKSM